MIKNIAEIEVPSPDAAMFCFIKSHKVTETSASVNLKSIFSDHRYQDAIKKEILY